MNQINWSLPAEQQHLDSVQRKFLQFCHSWDLHQIVKQPTRGHNFLDVILTTHPERYYDINTSPPLLNSDHDIVTCCVRSERIYSREARLERNFLYADYSAIAQGVSDSRQMVQSEGHAYLQLSGSLYWQRGVHGSDGRQGPAPKTRFPSI